MANRERPTVTENTGTLGGHTIKHPAFGQIIVSRSSGRQVSLYGSDLTHNNMVHIEIVNSEVERNLSRDWRHGKEMIVDFYMSESQWAQFVASAGMGEGTPITFWAKPAPGYKVMMVPGIEPHESEHEAHQREMKEAIAKRMQMLDSLISKLEEMMAAGKANKGQLSAALAEAKRVQGLPGVASFIAESFKESMEQTVENAKTEVEAFVYSVAMRTGIESLRNGAVSLIDDKSAETKSSHE